MNLNVNEIKKGDWIRSAYDELGLVNKVKGQTAYVSFDGSRSFDPMRVADLKKTSERHRGKAVYSEGKLTEDYSQRARNFRVALRRRLEAMKKGQKISYGKLYWVKDGKNFKANNGRTFSIEGIVQSLKHEVKPDIKTHRGAAGDGMVDAYLKFEGKLTEAKLTESMIGIQTKANFKPNQLKGALEKAGVKGFQMNRLSVTLTALKLDKKYYKTAMKIINALRLKVQMAKENIDVQLDQAFNDAKPVEERLKKGESGCCHACGHSHRKGSAHVTPYKSGKNSCANRKSESIVNSNVIIYEEHPIDLPPDDKAIEEYDCENAQDLREFLSYWKENYLCESCGKENIEEAEYQGRKVKLGKPTQGDVKKFKVYVKNPKGNIVKVNFGQGGDAKGGTMKIRKNNPKARASFRARHNCDSPGPRHKARYWSCRKW